MDLVMRGVAARYPGLPKPVLDVPALSIATGERVAVMGPSGAGKTTLINIAAGLDRPDEGEARWGGVDIAAMSEARRDAWRARHVGLVMQDFHLFAGLSAIDNVLLPQQLRAWSIDRGAVARAEELLRKVGLSRAAQKIETMSRGEMQRVAVARALQMKPSIIVADEPTASLDSDSAIAVADLLLALTAEAGATLIVVTHDEALEGRLSRIIRLEGGRIATPHLPAAA
ncbi:ABC transporter ATP-binding protein [Terrarubrum flagellatum]|uniref:ABC transporter ATP-binding protein n=1 Tax=Terrirubrum flagellatum TaxID=2895980 RepID=UPI00314559BF